MKIESKSQILIKFNSKDIIDSLQSGTVYMNNLIFFIKKELEENAQESGDFAEDQIFSYAFETPHGIPIKFSIKNDKSNFAYSLFSVPFSLKHFQFSKEQKEKLLSFGDTALIIYNSQEFLNRVMKEAENNGYELHHKGVILYNENEEITPEMMDYLTEGLYNISFFKRKKFQYQQEYRLAISKEKSKDDHIELDVGDISDISIQVNAKKILEEGIEIF